MTDFAQARRAIKALVGFVADLTPLDQALETIVDVSAQLETRTRELQTATTNLELIRKEADALRMDTAIRRAKFAEAYEQERKRAGGTLAEAEKQKNKIIDEARAIARAELDEMQKQKHLIQADIDHRRKELIGATQELTKTLEKYSDLRAEYERFKAKVAS